ncbi:MAG: tRNA (adenosine(37)-N6)-threonylcarbamoyltransferase complex ATPase subunit type 1 TsaE [Ruminococcaceae bacterium]|nr:tRNA (adenosine(37)-N6)-threonylcarbamoyltransferase complex ATPase subunit type 1 TsaE [Oscillospiraceae bacterium]
MTEYKMITCSPEETERVGGEVAVAAAQNNINFVAMYGDLGAGKTAFVRGMAEKLAPGVPVSSPTYSIVNEICPVGSHKPVLFHFDMYRIQSEDDLDSIDFDSYFLRGALIVCEWSENIEFALPDRYLRVDIEKTDENSRVISVREVSAKK